MLHANYFSMEGGWIIFVSNVSLKLFNLSLYPDDVLPQKRVEYTLIFQLLLRRDQKLKSKNDPILYALKISSSLKSTSAGVKDLFCFIRLVLFQNIRRNRVVKSQWHEGCVPEMTDNKKSIVEHLWEQIVKQTRIISIIKLEILIYILCFANVS